MKTHATKIEDQFVVKFSKVLASVNATIKANLQKKMTVRAAVSDAFKKHNVKGNLQKLVLDSVESAYNGN